MAGPTLRITAGALLAGCVVAAVGCASPVVAVEYRTGHVFSRSERAAIQRVADRAARDVRQLLPGLPTDLRITVQAGDRVIPETGETGSIGLPGAVYWTVDPRREGGVLAVVAAQLRATLFHEWYHLVREGKFSPRLGHTWPTARCVSPGSRWLSWLESRPKGSSRSLGCIEIRGALPNIAVQPRRRVQ